MPSPVPYLRAMTAFVGRTALLATALLLVSHPVAAPADYSLCPQKRMVIVAHLDDDIIFENPGLLESIAAGDCVRTVFVTAGDAGLGEAYWREREEGSRAAYATMAGVANFWTTSEPSVAGHNLHMSTLAGKPTVSEVYLHLPDGGGGGKGFAATGNESLPKLWRSHNPQPADLLPITELNAIDGSATYTYEGLLATLEGLIEEFQPDVLSTQDFVHEFGAGDHADHIATAKLVQIADGSYGSEHVLRSYMDYESKDYPVNVFEPALAKKLNAYYAYAAHDSNEACASQTACEQPYYADYWAWLKRQIVLAESAVPGADAGPNQSVASGASVTLDGSGSSDPLGHSLSYEWTQTAGPTVALSNSHAVKPTFTAPTGPSTLTFSLVVDSSEAGSLADPVNVTVAAPPSYQLSVAKAGTGSGTVSSSPSGIDCGSTCEHSYLQGSEVTLSAAPATGSEFKGWSGACGGTGTCLVTMSAARSVTATFDLERHSLSVVKTGSGSGTVTSAPAGIDCGSSCAASFDHGATVTLSAAASGGSQFAGWSGACTGTGACVVAMSAAKSVTAEFAPIPSYQLSVAKAGTGSGTVSSSPSGIDCGSTCEHSYLQGSEVTLSAAPATGSEFKGWSGACGGTGTCLVTMSAARSVTATFDLERHSLSVVKTGSGSGTVTSAPAGIDCGSSCAASFDHGATVTLSAAASGGSQFAGWSGACTGTGACVVAMSAAKSVTAEFAPIPSYQLSVAKAGTGSGTVSSSPSGIDCGSTCEHSYLQGSEVTLSAAPATGSEFKGWSGACGGTGTCLVTMSAARSVTATFDLERHSLSVVKTGSGSGTVTSAPAGIDCGSSCAASFDHGATVTLSAAASGGSQFAGWSGACTGTGACVVAMSAAKSVTAEFAPIPSYQLSVAKAGTGSGTVSSSPSGIDCGSTCEHSYLQGSEVTLSAAPATGSEFKGWSGACGGTGTCLVTMSAARSVTATFDLERHSLSVVKTGSGSGTVTSAPAGIDCGSSCAASFDHGATVTLSAAASGGSQFAGWSGACTGTGACVVAMSAAKSVTAEFAPIPSYQLSVAKAGTGSGTVSSSPSGIDCGSTCEHSYLQGSEVTLSAAPATGSEFKGWSGACGGTGTCLVTMSAARSVTATFDLERHSLSVVKTGSGSGTVTSAPAGIDCGSSCAASFDHGATVTLSGSVGAETKPVAWSGCDAIVAGDECRVSMVADKEVFATLEAVAPPLSPTPPTSASAPDVPPTWEIPATKLLKTKIARRHGTARFAFTARGNVTKFHCALSRTWLKPRYAACTSPVTYRDLGAGAYVFKVRAVGPGGAEATPVTRRFAIPFGLQPRTRHESKARRRAKAWIAPNRPLPARTGE